MVKVYLTGGSSILGRYLINTMPDNVELTATYLNHDVRDQCENKKVRWEKCDLRGPMFHIHPDTDVIIHAAAIGSVDYCEANRQEAYQVNYEGSCKIAEVARHYGCQVVYISTNAVYDGKEPLYSPHREQQPVNYYGVLKSLSEDMFRQLIPATHRTIIRPIMLYGWSWENATRKSWVEKFLTNMKDSFQKSFTHKGEDTFTYVVGDVITQLTYAETLARFIWCRLLLDEVGEYNFATCYPRSLYSFAMDVVDVFDLDRYCAKRASLSDFPTIAPRPLDTTYNLDHLQSLTEYTYESATFGLTRMKNERH